MQKLLFCGLLSGLSLTVTAQAGFIAATGTDAYTYGGAGSAATPAVGGSFTVTNAPLQSYTADTPADPQIAAGDVANFLFSLNLNITSVDGASGAIQTSGTYSLFYDLGSNGTPDLRVSSGTASLYLVPAFSGFDVVTGSLAQVLGPQDPTDFRDLAYGDNGNLVLQGGYVDLLGGDLSLSLRQNAVAVAPEPGSLGLLAGAGLLSIRRRRRA